MGLGGKPINENRNIFALSKTPTTTNDNSLFGNSTSSKYIVITFVFDVLSFFLYTITIPINLFKLFHFTTHLNRLYFNLSL